MQNWEREREKEKKNIYLKVIIKEIKKLLL